MSSMDNTTEFPFLCLLVGQQDFSFVSTYLPIYSRSNVLYSFNFKYKKRNRSEIASVHFTLLFPIPIPSTKGLGRKPAHVHFLKTLPTHRQHARVVSLQHESNSVEHESGKKPPLFLFISLLFKDMDETLSRDLFEKLELENEVLKAETEEQALEHLTWPRPKAVLVADGAIGDYKHKLFRDCLVEFVKKGGTVVHACAFHCIGVPAFNRYFKHGWGVEWKAGACTRGVFRLKESGGHGISRKKLPASFDQQAVIVQNVSAKDAIYLEENARDPSDDALCESVVVFTKIEAGYMEFIGDTYYTEDSDRVIFAMFGMD